jgi:cation transport protein ChaC
MRLTRSLVDLLPEAIEDPGPMAMVSGMEDNDYHQRTARDILDNRDDDGELWVFAYGSLIWKPRFTHVERRHAVVDGWQRSFCLGPDTRYRGNPDAPGVMLSLIQGGRCEGIVFQMAQDTLETELIAMLESEPPIPPAWIDAETEAGIVRCITHVCPPSFTGHIDGMSSEDIADLLQAAVGMLGSMPDYLYNTVRNLEEVGIHDPYLWQMQELVAQRLERLGGKHLSRIR